MAEDCPKCGRTSLETGSGTKYCLYQSCGFLEKIPTIEERIDDLEKQVLRLTEIILKGGERCEN